MIRTKKIYVRGDKLYISSYTDAGRVRIATGLKDSAKNRQILSEKIEEIIYKRLRGENIKQEKPKNYTLQALSAEFLQSLEYVKETTLVAYKSMANVLSGVFKNKDLRLFPKQELERILYNKHKKYLHFFNRLSVFANEKYALNIPKLKPKRAITIKSEPKPFNLEEMELLLTRAGGTLKVFLHLAFLTGARTGEILALEWEDIDFENKKIYINKSENSLGKITEPKTYSSVRFIDLLEPLERYLLTLKKSRGQIVKGIKRGQLRKEFDALQSRQGLDRRIIYNTRHTFASLMLSNGEEPLWVASMLGHKNLNITYEFYARWIPQKTTRAGFLNNLIKKEERP